MQSLWHPNKERSAKHLLQKTHISAIFHIDRAFSKWLVELRYMFGFQPRHGFCSLVCRVKMDFLDLENQTQFVTWKANCAQSKYKLAGVETVQVRVGERREKQTVKAEQKSRKNTSYLFGSLKSVRSIISQSLFKSWTWHKEGRQSIAFRTAILSSGITMTCSLSFHGEYRCHWWQSIALTSFWCFIQTWFMGVKKQTNHKTWWQHQVVCCGQS